MGIDPGRRGGYALCSFDGERSLVIRSGMLQYVDVTPHAHTPMLDLDWMQEELFPIWRVVMPAECSVLVIERQMIGPADSARNGFMTSFNYGMLISAAQIEMLRKPPDGMNRIRKLVTPSPVSWKRELGLSKLKSESLDMATTLFENGNEHWPLKKHDGIAEAALLAYWFRRKRWKGEEK